MTDYARTYRIPALVFRMSCIYGPHQYGNEDQGWVAHFVIRSISGKPITIYGDGMQVRDILFVDDLVEAFLLAQQHMKKLAGSVQHRWRAGEHYQPAGITGSAGGATSWRCFRPV